LADYIAAARTRPVRYGSSGAGSALHILGGMLSGAADLRELDHTPYQGSGPAIRDLLGGHIESVIDPITTNVEALRSGQLRALAVSTRERLAAFPDIPTFAEQGYPTIVQTVWLGLSGPRGLPEPIAARMKAAIPTVLQTPTVQERMAQLVTLSRDPPPLGADFVEIMQADMRTAREVARRYNITSTS
jgi:tripartite-type tricarboxylate transporter receptor subunit TctC